MQYPLKLSYARNVYVAHTVIPMQSYLEVYNHDGKAPPTTTLRTKKEKKEKKLSKWKVDPEEVIILDREERWFGVREEIWERIEQHSLNKRGR